VKKLRTKFVVFILLPVLGTLVLAGVVSFLVSRSILIQVMIHAYTIGLRQAVDQVEQGAWRGLQSLLILVGLERTLTLSDAELRDLLNEIRKELPIDALFVAFPDGRFIASVDRPGMPEKFDPRRQPWYEQAVRSDEPVVIPLGWSKLSGRMVVSVSRKIVGPDGNLKGVAGYEIPLETIHERMSRMKLLEEFPGAHVSLFTGDGQYIVHSNREKSGRRISDSHDDLQIRIRQALEQGESSWHSIGESGGRYWFGGFEQTSFSGLYVAVEIPITEAIGPLIMLGVASALVVLIAVLLLSVMLSIMAKKIAKPVNMLAAASRRLTRGDYSEKLPVVSRDELGSLIEAFNKMAEGLRQRDFIRDTFGRYVTQEVVDRLLESDDGLALGGKITEISILMSDLRGFTAQTANMNPEKVLSLLNRYLGGMVEILLDHQAVVDEIIGDGILAFFGAPAAMQDHAARAVACALKMQAAMDSINGENKADGLPRLEMGIGVNTGTVVVGNIGSERRTKYGIVGTEVNLAGRIESYTVGGQVLVSESTFQRVRGIVEVRDVIQTEMKGLQGPVRLYDVNGIGAPYNIHIEDRPDEPTPLEKPIPVRISRVFGTVITPIQGYAYVTQVSERSAVILTREELPQRSEIRLGLLDDSYPSRAGDVFAKVISTRAAGDEYETTIRFAFVPPEIRRFFRQVLALH